MNDFEQIITTIAPEAASVFKERRARSAQRKRMLALLLLFMLTLLCKLMLVKSLQVSHPPIRVKGTTHLLAEKIQKDFCCTYSGFSIA